MTKNTPPEFSAKRLPPVMTLGLILISILAILVLTIAVIENVVTSPEERIELKQAGVLSKTEPTPEQTPAEQTAIATAPNPISKTSYKEEGVLTAVAFKVRQEPETEAFKVIADSKIAGELIAAIERILVFSKGPRTIPQGSMIKAVYWNRGDLPLTLYGIEISHSDSDFYLKAFLYWINRSVAPQLFQPNGTALIPRLMNSPLKGPIIGVDRPNTQKPEEGLDLIVPTGTPVVLPMAGTVIRVNWSSDLGNCVEVEYFDKKVRAQFLHLQSISTDVQTGAVLAENAVIGRSGGPSDSTTPRLRYRIEQGEDSHPADPFEIHGKQFDKVPKNESDEFERVKSRINELFAVVIFDAPGRAQPVEESQNKPAPKTMVQQND